MNKKLILISALLFIVGCERETTFTCLNIMEITVSKDKSHIYRGLDEYIGTVEVIWKSTEHRQDNEIVYFDGERPFSYNTKEKTLTVGWGFPPQRRIIDCPRK